MPEYKSLGWRPTWLRRSKAVGDTDYRLATGSNNCQGCFYNIVGEFQPAQLSCQLVCGPVDAQHVCDLFKVAT